MNDTIESIKVVKDCLKDCEDNVRHFIDAEEYIDCYFYIVAVLDTLKGFIEELLQYYKQTFVDRHLAKTLDKWSRLKEAAFRLCNESSFEIFEENF